VNAAPEDPQYGCQCPACRAIRQNPQRLPLETRQALERNLTCIAHGLAMCSASRVDWLTAEGVCGLVVCGFPEQFWRDVGHQALLLALTQWAKAKAKP
jgi:hypothetical protein